MPVITPTKDSLLTAFVNKMMEEKGTGDLDSEARLRLRVQLREKLEQRVEENMIRMLTDEQLVELERLLDADVSDAALEQFFDESGADFTQAATQAMMTFRQDYLQAEAM